jgi:protein-L-isoaspartate(D-aspartate) O-methyltransferase
MATTFGSDAAPFSPGGHGNTLMHAPSHLSLRIFLCLLGLSAWGQPLVMAQDDDPYRKAREKMVEERIVREGIKNDRVLDAMREVPRHKFVQPKFAMDAYREMIILIGHKQTLSPAYIVAYMTEAIDPQPTDRVLEIGTGSGYQAAILGKLVKEVYTIEIVEPLGREATARLKELGYTNVQTRVGDGFKGWPEAAPFDKIIVTCSPESLPQPLADQLKEGGKLIIPLGERYRQAFYLFENREGRLVKTRLLPTLFVPMTGIAESERKVHGDPANPRIANGNFTESTNGIADAWFYQRQTTLEANGGPDGRKAYLEFANSQPGRDAHAIQAIGIDGSKVKSVTISVYARGEAILQGLESYERPALAIRFFDSQNRMIAEEGIGPWLGTFTWRQFKSDIPVPRDAKMAMIQIGLRGATGRLGVADVRIVRRQTR